jgi:hypothetical protein
LLLLPPCYNDNADENNKEKGSCPSFFQVEIIIMSLAMMMIKGWRVSWMLMLWSSFI